MLQSLTALSWCTWYEHRKWIYNQKGKCQHRFKQGVGSAKAWKLQILPVLLSMLANQGLILCMSSKEIPDFPELERACIDNVDGDIRGNRLQQLCCYLPDSALPGHEAGGQYTSS